MPPRPSPHHIAPALLLLLLFGCSDGAVDLSPLSGPELAADAATAPADLNQVADARPEDASPTPIDLATGDAGPAPAADAAQDSGPDLPPAPPVLDIDFDSGSLDLDATRIEGDLVRLVGRDNSNGGRWKWIYFRIRNARGWKPSFVIGDNFASGSSRLTDHAMVFSHDQRRWTFFDHNSLTAGTFRFEHDAPFEHDEVYVAYGLPYPLGELQDLVARLKPLPSVSPTSSADADLVVARSPGSVDDLGRTIAPQPLYGFRITSPAVEDAGKEEVVLVGGVHANETTGSHALHGLIDFLVSDDPAARSLRRRAIFYVYPMVNPEGRLAGYNRHTVARPGDDPNRQWDPALWDDHHEIRAIGQAMKADTNGDVDYLLDFHSTVGTASHYAYLDKDQQPTGRDMRDDPFWTSLEDRAPRVGKDGTYVGRTTMRFGWHELRAEFSSTLEWYFRPGEGVTRYRDHGRAIGMALADAI